MDEEWRPVLGHEAFCEVSNLGRVKRIAHIVFRYGRERRVAERLIIPQKVRGGYWQCSYGMNGKRVFFYLHRAVAEAFIPKPDMISRYEVDHIDGNKDHNSTDNLQWLTHRQNLDKYWESMSTKAQNTCAICGGCIDWKAKICRDCYNAQQSAHIPEVNLLLSVLRDVDCNWAAAGRYFGTNANRIKAWCKRYGLPMHSSDIKDYMQQHAGIA